MLTASLFLLNLIKIESDPSGFHFPLIFAMLAPHIFDTRRVYAALFAYLALSVCAMLSFSPLLIGEIPQHYIAHFILMAAATAVSARLVRTTPGRAIKASLAAYYIASLALAAMFARPPRFTHIWLMILVFMPALIFWRMRPFVGKFWLTAAPAVVFVPLHFIIDTIFTHTGFGPHNLLGTGQLINETQLFTQMVLPLPAYFLLAAIAAVLLTHLDGRTLRSDEVKDRITVRKLD